MKKLFLLFLFPFYLFSSELSRVNGCCGSASFGGWVHLNKNVSQHHLGSYESTASWVAEQPDYICVSLGIQQKRTFHNTPQLPPNEYGRTEESKANCVGDPCPSGQELVGAECLEICEEGLQRNDEGTCEEIPQDPEGECNEGYTLTTGYTTLLPSRCNSCITNQTCLDAYTLRQMTDSEEQLCCIKFDDPQEEEEQTPETPDNNSTPIDLNPTNEILEDIRDDANLNADQLEQEERETQERLDEVNRILAGLNEDNNENATAGITNQNSNTDRTIANDNTNANQAHQDQLTNQGKYDDIILGLREVKDATTNMTANANANSQREIDNANANAEQAHTDAQNSDAQNQDNADRNHEDLEDIKDALGGLNNGENFTGEFTQAIDGLSQLDGMIQEGRESVIDSFNTMVVDYTGMAPVFSASGDCVESFEVFGTTIELDFNFFANVKFAFDIIFTLLLAFITFKVYLFIFVSLTSKV